MESLRETSEDVDLHQPPHTVPALAGVVLCGGRSRRMGADKATIEIAGSTLLERAVLRLGEVCDPVLIAAGGLRLDGAGHEIVEDAVPGGGPLAGVVAALRHNPHPLLAVVAVDMPWLDPGLLRLLAGWIGIHDAALCETAGGIEPLHAVFATSSLGAAEAALRSPDRSMHGFLGRLRVLTLSESAWRAAAIPERFARNVNTPEDLAELRRELRPAMI
jgi:molybdopterin-guanine dinucleotide biosynthesis protein A